MKIVISIQIVKKTQIKKGDKEKDNNDNSITIKKNNDEKNNSSLIKKETPSSMSVTSV